MSKLHIKKGDTVYVNSGEDKGKTGRVLKVLVKEGRALVEGINMVSKSTKPNAKNPQGGIVKQEAAIHISNLNLVDPKTGKPTRVGRRESSDGRTFVRYAKKSFLLRISYWFSFSIVYVFRIWSSRSKQPRTAGVIRLMSTPSSKAKITVPSRTTPSPRPARQQISRAKIT